MKQPSPKNRPHFGPLHQKPIADLLGRDVFDRGVMRWDLDQLATSKSDQRE